MTSLSILVLLILLSITIIVIQNKRSRKGLPLEGLEKVAIYLDISAALVYIIFTAINSLAGLNLKIPTDLIWIVLIILITSVIVTVVVRLKQRRYVMRIDGVMAYVFFPAGTLETDKTLDFHKKHCHKKLVVNFRRTPPQAYYLVDTNTSYAWKMVNKYPDMWTPVEDSFPDQDTAKWCENNGYEFHPWSATKAELLVWALPLSSDLLAKLKERKLSGKLDDFRIVFLCPWYRFRSSGKSSDKVILQKRSAKEVYDAPLHFVELGNNQILRSTTKVKWPWQTLKGWSKRHGGYTYMDWFYTEEQLLGET
jgi:hypothetical protein